MNDSDTELVAEDESIISTIIIRKEDIRDQSSSVSVPEASIHISSTQNEYETNTLDQDERNSAPATQRTSNQSPSPTTQRTSNQSPSPTTQRTSNQSPSSANQRTANQSTAAAATRHISNQSSKSTPPSTVTLPKNTHKRKQSSMIKDKSKRNKGQCSMR